MKKISENIVTLRTMKGLTAEKLSEKLGVARQTVSNWERGTAIPRGDNLKNLCDVLEVTMDQLLGKQPLNTDKKIEIAIDELKTDLKEEEIKTKKQTRKAIIKKVISTALVLLVVITIIHTCCSIYKYNVLTDIGEKVSIYRNQENYYCEIQTYEDNKLKQKEEIWYKNNEYKIIAHVYNDIGNIITKATEIIDLNKNTKSIYDNDEYIKTMEFTEKEKYENGKYMYSLFPDIIKNKSDSKIKNSLKINKFKSQTIKERNIYNLMINSQSVELDNNTYAPISYTNGEHNNNIRMYFKVKLDCVKDEDVKN